MADATFRAGGLASGIDSNTIIDKLMELEARPVNLVKTRQEAVKTQISSLADIRSKLSDLALAGRNLASAGAVATTVGSTATGFDAVTGSGAVAGRHTVKVTALASAASHSRLLLVLPRHPSRRAVSISPSRARTTASTSPLEPRWPTLLIRFARPALRSARLSSTTARKLFSR